MAKKLTKEPILETIEEQPLVVNKISDEEAVKGFIQDEKVQNTLKQAADEFTQTFRDKWFTIGQVNRKTRFKEPADAFSILNMLTLGDFCAMRNDRKMIEYKIILDKKDKADVILIQIDFLKKEYQRKLELLEKDYKYYSSL